MGIVLLLRYTLEGLKSHLKVALGSAPLDEALKKARIELARVDNGENPAQAKAEAKAAWTVAPATDAGGSSGFQIARSPVRAVSWMPDIHPGAHQSSSPILSSSTW